ncbi:MAG: hypothetical protein AAF414_17950 [Pseudomonadota bacterium]
MTGKATRPEDILLDDEDYVVVHGVRVRKGSIAAAMRNIDLLETGSNDERTAALEMIKALAPGLVALGMHRHFICRNPVVDAILAEAAKDQDG